MNYCVDPEIKTHLKSIYDSSAELSMEKITDIYNGETINLLELLLYSYIDPKYKTISPHDLDKSDKKMDTHDKKMETSEKEIYTDGETTEEDMVTQYDQTAQEQDMDTFDENDCVITRDVFMGYSEAKKPQFIMEHDLYIHDNDGEDAAAAAADYDYLLDSINTLLPLDLL